MLQKNNQFFKAVSVLVGTVIGAGIFGLPYAVAKVGFVIGGVYILIIGLAILAVNFCYGEVVLRTKEHCRMSGYAEKYLGRWGKALITISLVLGLYGALLAYTIGVGNFLYDILNPYLGGTPFVYSLIFWLIASLAIFRGLGIIASVELFMVGLLVFMVISVFGFSLPEINLTNLTYFNFENLFFPFGVVLFALGGATAVPTMREVLKDKIKLLKKSIIWGMVIPILLYIIFCLSVVGITGYATTEQAIGGLARVLGREVLFIGGFFGILTMTTSFLALGYVLRELYHQDYKIPRSLASGLTCLVPLIIFVLGLRSFVKVIGVSGSILGGFQGILLIMMYYKSKKSGDRKPEYSFNLPKPVAYFLYLLFTFGVVYQVYYLLS